MFASFSVKYNPNTSELIAPTAVAFATANGFLTSTQRQPTWANTAARTAATPAFIGQVGLQLDTAQFWSASSTSAGGFDETAFTANQFSAGQSLSVGTSSSIEGQIFIRQDTSAFVATIKQGAVFTGNHTFTLPNSAGALVVDTATQTLSGKTLTAPRFADLGFIADANGNEILVLDTVASAVNELRLANAATGGNIVLAAQGGDTDVDIEIQPKGAANLLLTAGGSSSTVKLGGTLTTDTTQTGNVGAGEDTLQTYSLPASTLSVNGNTMYGQVSGTTANDASAKVIRVKFGATTIFESETLADFDYHWTIQWRVTRTGAATQKAIAWMNTNNNATPYSSDCQYSTPTETLSGAVTVLVTGEATSDNDIVKEIFKAFWEP